MPNQKEVRWSQLKVGVVVLAAIVILIALAFLMSNSIGLFSRKLRVHAYFENAAGLKVGAPVNLDGVTIGNVSNPIRIDSSHPLTPVMVTMKISDRYGKSLRKDSTASLTTVGVLGDTVVDIDSQHATGPELRNGDELSTTETPSIPDVIKASQGTVAQLNVILSKVNGLLDNISSGKGTLGQLISSNDLNRKLLATMDQVQTLTTNINQGKGSLGKLIVDDSLYNRANDTINHLDRISSDLDAGKGTAGKLLKDDSVYNDLKKTLDNTNQIVSDINAGKGGLGYIAKDPQFPKKLNETLNHLNDVLARIDKGEGTLGQLSVNDSFYKHTDQLITSSNQLVEAIRKDPKKYFVIRLKMF
jgi:phospholipid/cholesterol/gamma-HCH transport system substrate-binding protein